MEIKKPKNLKVELFHMAPDFTNSVMVSYGDNCVIFDAWGRADDWLKVLHSRKLNLNAIYSTHGHPDHISATPDLVLATGGQWFLDKNDFDLIGWGDDLLANFGLKPITRDVVPNILPLGRTNILGNVAMDVIACPGHTRGGVSFYIQELGLCLTGDTLFSDSIGRTDLPGGDIYKLKETITNFYNLNLPDDTVVVPGHGEVTTIAKMKQENPFFRVNKINKNHIR